MKISSCASNTKILIGFLEWPARQQKSKVFLILENLQVRQSKLVKRWLTENADKIEASYLRRYSPELNPDELLNADLKKLVTIVAPMKTNVA
jgi:hypothetical protein